MEDLQRKDLECEYRVYGLECGNVGCRVWVVACRVQGLGLRVEGLGFGVCDLGEGRKEARGVDKNIARGACDKV